MSQSIRDFEKSITTGSSSLKTSEYLIVKQDTDGTLILASASTDKFIGVLQNKPDIGQAGLVRFIGTTKAIAGGTIAVGSNVTSDSAGKVVATTTTKDRILGTYLGSASAASGDVVEILLHISYLAA